MLGLQTLLPPINSMPFPQITPHCGVRPSLVSLLPATSRLSCPFRDGRGEAAGQVWASVSWLCYHITEPVKVKEEGQTGVSERPLPLEAAVGAGGWAAHSHPVTLGQSAEGQNPNKPTRGPCRANTRLP